MANRSGVSRGRPKKDKAEKREVRLTIAFSENEIAVLIERWRGSINQFTDPTTRQIIANGLSHENMPSFIYYAGRELFLPTKTMTEIYPYGILGPECPPSDSADMQKEKNLDVGMIQLQNTQTEQGQELPGSCNEGCFGKGASCDTSTGP